MRKYLLYSLTLAVLFLISISSADATLLGVKHIIAPLYPDIHCNNVGLIRFDPDPGGGGSLFYTALPSRIKYSRNPNDWDPFHERIDYTVAWDLDSSGNLLAGGTMDLFLKAGESVEISGKTYSGGGSGLSLLSGSVTAFGWDNLMEFPYFDFWVDSLSGPLVTDGVWSAGYPTGIEGEGAGATYYDEGGTDLGWPSGDWWNRTNGFEIDKVKSDMAPTIPEPTTLILLGSGLVGLMGYAWRRKKKQS